MPLTGDRRPRPVPAGGNADAPAVPACVYDEQSEQEPLRQKRQEGVPHEAIAQKSAVCQLFQLIEELFPLAPRTEQTYAYDQQAQLTAVSRIGSAARSRLTSTSTAQMRFGIMYR